MTVQQGRNEPRHTTAAAVEVALAFLVDSGRAASIFDDVKKDVLRDQSRDDALEEAVRQYMEEQGHATFLRNCAFAVRLQLAFSSFSSHVPFRDNAPRCQACVPQLWLDFLAARLARIHHMLGLPCAPAKKLTDVPEFDSLGAGRSCWDVGQAKACLDRSPAVYTAQDVLVAICQPQMLQQMVVQARHGRWDACKADNGHGACKTCKPVMASSAKLHDTGRIHLLDGSSSVLASSCAVPRSSLKVLFKEMHLKMPQVGVDDVVNPEWAELRAEEAWEAVGAASLAGARTLLRQGASADTRPKLWELALGLLPISDAEQALFQNLKERHVLGSPLIQQLLEKDMELIANSQHFFLFEDLLRSVMQVFNQDARLLNCCSVPGFPRFSLGSEWDAAPPALQLTPPCGLVPFQGQALYAAPLCYLYCHPAEVHRVLRSMYCRFWCRLHSPVLLRDDPLPGLSCIAQLLHTFHALLEVLDPEVVSHLVSLGVQPLSLVAPWLAAAFVGHLEMEQLLLLWDRVIGYDSLLPLAMLAAAILSFRHDAIMSAGSPSQVQLVLADLSQLKVMPLLQAIFTTTIATA